MNKATHLISAEAPGLGRPQLPPEENAEQEHSCPLPNHTVYKQSRRNHISIHAEPVLRWLRGLSDGS